MDAELTHESVLKQIGPGFSEADACAIVDLGPEGSIFTILTMAKLVAELNGWWERWIHRSLPAR